MENIRFKYNNGPGVDVTLANVDADGNASVDDMVDDIAASFNNFSPEL